VPASIADGDRAAAFAGGFVSVPYRPEVDPSGGSFSIEAWVQLAAPSTGVVAGSLANYGEFSYGYALRLVDGRAQFRGVNGDPIFTIDDSRALDDNVWHHLAGVFDVEANEVRLVVDGALSGTAVPTESLSGNDFFIGSEIGGATDLLTAAVDEVAFYDHVLSAARIADHVAVQHDALAGNGTIDYSVAYVIDANPFGFERSGTISLNDVTIPIVQHGVSCSFSVSPTALSVGSGASGGAIDVTATAPGCTWTAATETPWITPQRTLDGYVGQVVRDGAQGYWRLSDAGVVAVDSTGHGFDGTYVGEGRAHVPGPIAGDIATEFNDGMTSVATADIPVTATDSPYSYEVWVRFTGSQSGMLLNHGSFVVGLADDRVYFAALWTTLSSSRSLNDGSWHHVVGVSDPVNQAIRLFIDGLVDGSTESTFNFHPTIPVTIGFITSGSVDEAAIYPSVLSATQVARHFVARGSTSGGNGRALFDVAANPTIEPRVGAVTVAGSVVPVTQSGRNCFDVNPQTIDLTSEGGAGTIGLLALDGACGWTAVSDASWLVLDGASGNGSADLHYTVPANGTPFTRVAQISTAGYTVTVTQTGVPLHRPTLGYSVAVGGRHSLAQKNDGSVWSWGGNDYGQLGDGSHITRYTPSPIASLTDVVAIAAGASPSLALKADGTVWAWGGNNFGEIGDGTVYTPHLEPYQLSGLTDVVAVAAGNNHSVALTADGSVWTWGRNDNNQLGDGSGSNQSSPVRVVGLPFPVTSIAAAGEHTVVADVFGSVLPGEATPTVA
jgi:hypothetical protein